MCVYWGSRKIRALREELTKERIKLQEADRKHEVLTNAIPEATRPLVRQIEALKKSAQAQANAFRLTEKELK